MEMVGGRSGRDGPPTWAAAAMERVAVGPPDRRRMGTGPQEMETAWAAMGGDLGRSYARRRRLAPPHSDGAARGRAMCRSKPARSSVGSRRATFGA